MFHAQLPAHIVGDIISSYTNHLQKYTITVIEDASTSYSASAVGKTRMKHSLQISKNVTQAKQSLGILVSHVMLCAEIFIQDPLHRYDT